MTTRPDLDHLARVRTAADLRQVAHQGSWTASGLDLLAALGLPETIAHTHLARARSQPWAFDLTLADAARWLLVDLRTWADRIPADLPVAALVGWHLACSGTEPDYAVFRAALDAGGEHPWGWLALAAGIAPAEFAAADWAVDALVTLAVLRGHAWAAAVASAQAAASSTKGREPGGTLPSDPVLTFAISNA